MVGRCLYTPTSGLIFESYFIIYLFFLSVSVTAPTFITAIPPESFAIRSFSFSISEDEPLVMIYFFSCSQRFLLYSVGGCHIGDAVLSCC